MDLAALGGDGENRSPMIRGMRTILLMAALAACGGDSAHDVVDCTTWPQFTGVTKCERACAAGPSNSMPGAACHQPNGKIDCADSSIATFEGERGCCVPVGSGPVEFTPCEGE